MREFLLQFNLLARSSNLTGSYNNHSASFETTNLTEKFNYSDLFSMLSGQKSTNNSNLTNHLFILIYAVIFLVGLVGNFLVIYFVLVYKRMQTMTNKLITNLSIADLLVIFICVPVTASGYVTRNWLFGELVCKASGFVQGVALSVSVLTLTAISIDRYFIISKPMKVKSICTNSKVKLIVIFIWLVSLIIMSPLLAVFKFERQVIQTGPSRSDMVIYTVCFEKWPLFEAKLFYGIFLLVVLFVLPIVFMSYAYFIIGKELWFVKKNLGFEEALQDSNHTNQNVENGKVSRFSRGRKKKSDAFRSKDSRHDFSLIEVSSSKVNHDRIEGENPGSTRSKLSYCCIFWCHHRNEDTRIGENQRGAFGSLVNRPLHVQTNDSRRLLSERRAASTDIGKHIKFSKQRRNVEAINNLIESRRRVVRLSIVLVLLFLFSWLPYHIISLSIDLLLYGEQKTDLSESSDLNLSTQQPATTKSQFISIYIYPIALCLALANSVTNPVCYITLSHGFRNMFKTSFRRIFNRNL